MEANRRSATSSTIFGKATGSALVHRSANERPHLQRVFTAGEKQGARLQLQKSENQTEALKNSIDKEVDDAKRNFTSAITAMDYQKKNMQLAEKYMARPKKYEIGTGSATEINPRR